MSKKNKCEKIGSFLLGVVITVSVVLGLSLLKSELSIQIGECYKHNSKDEVGTYAEVNNVSITGSVRYTILSSGYNFYIMSNERTENEFNKRYSLVNMSFCDTAREIIDLKESLKKVIEKLNDLQYNQEKKK